MAPCGRYRLYGHRTLPYVYVDWQLCVCWHFKDIVCSNGSSLVSFDVHVSLSVHRLHIFAGLWPQLLAYDNHRKPHRLLAPSRQQKVDDQWSSESSQIRQPLWCWRHQRLQTHELRKNSCPSEEDTVAVIEIWPQQETWKRTKASCLERLVVHSYAANANDCCQLSSWANDSKHDPTARVKRDVWSKLKLHVSKSKFGAQCKDSTFLGGHTETSQSPRWTISRSRQTELCCRLVYLLPHKHLKEGWLKC